MNTKIDNFIKKSNDIHNNKYDYSKVDYINNSTKVCIICPEHGEFWQTPNSHLSGVGCPSCYGNKKLTNTQFIEECKKIHNGKYSYDKTHYKNKRSKVIITCPIHGDFEQLAANHKRGQGCPECGKKYAKEYRKYNHQHFINESNSRFDNEYEFPNIINEYENSHSKITIKHNKCNTFFTKIACDHITSPYGGCPHCFINKSFPEIEIFNFVKDLLSENELIYTNCRNIIDNELDIYIPNLNIAIEFNGLYWHSELQKTVDYHINKTNQCNEKGIRLIHIFEDEWLYKQDIVKSMLRNLLSKTENKIYARNCFLKEVSYNDTNEFLNKNHIQGMCVSKIRYGLYYNNELVSVMTFGNLRKNLNCKKNDNEYELLRFCNKLNTNVIGGASKLFKHFIKNIKPSSITSYADRRYSNGNLYNVLGFKLDHISKPNYSYIIKGLRYNRFSFRKNILIEKYDCPQTTTEHEFMKSKGWYRIYDCGCFCYKMFF